MNKPNAYDNRVTRREREFIDSAVRRISSMWEAHRVVNVINHSHKLPIDSPEGRAVLNALATLVIAARKEP